jgi:hypothetical protein
MFVLPSDFGRARSSESLRRRNAQVGEIAGRQYRSPQKSLVRMHWHLLSKPRDHYCRITDEQRKERSTTRRHQLFVIVRDVNVRCQHT